VFDALDAPCLMRLMQKQQAAPSLLPSKIDANTEDMGVSSLGISINEVSIVFSSPHAGALALSDLNLVSRVRKGTRE